MKITFDKQLYGDITKLSNMDELENVMLIGAIQSGESIDSCSKTFKWFTSDELRIQTSSNAVVNESIMARQIKQIINEGCNTVILIRTHPCKTPDDDWVYGILNDDDLTASKNVELMCKIQGVNFYSGVSTNSSIYFWRLEPRSLKPLQVNCEVDGEDVTIKVPSTLEELVKKMQN